MDEYKFFIKLARVVIPSLCATVIVLVSIIMYSEMGRLPDSILGVIVGGCVGVLASAVIGGNKQEEHKGVTSNGEPNSK